MAEHEPRKEPDIPESLAPEEKQRVEKEFIDDLAEKKRVGEKKIMTGPSYA